METRKTYLVTGATGRQGGAVVRSLLSRGRKVRVLTRFPGKAVDLVALGAEVVRGDFEEVLSLMKAARGVDGVFLMGTPFERGVRAEVAHGKAAVAAFRKAGSFPIVYSSAFGANRRTGVPHLESKSLVEKELMGYGPDYAILRPAWFMENLESPSLRPLIRLGVLSLPLASETRLSMIAVSDIGECAAQALLRPAEFLQAEIDLAGDRLSMKEIAALIGGAGGREVRYEPVPADRAEAAVGHDMSLMYRWLDRQRSGIDIEALRSRFGIPLTPFARFLVRSGLSRKAA